MIWTRNSVVALAVMLPVVGFAQIQITGRVLDPANAPISAATASLTGIAAEIRQSASANKGGLFAFHSVPPGAYVLRVSAPGFLSRRLALSEFPAGQDVDLGSVVLPIGAMNEGPVTPAKPLKKTKPFTVCESQANARQLDRKAIAVVGRIHCGATLIDQACFLVEDRCDPAAGVDGIAIPNKMPIIDYWEEGMPRPPFATPQMDRAVLLKKLSAVAARTKLGWHKEPLLEVNGQTVTVSRTVDAKDEWGIAYGVLVIERGNGSPAVLITLPGALHSIGGPDSSGAAAGIPAGRARGNALTQPAMAVP